ncbi:MAG: hypothetical protein LBD13_01405 [Spirochaetaceae bacterium]|jgi:hypothetical protein|nr:hypothetical protein [Spirochaetaceae bacterium]
MTLSERNSVFKAGILIPVTALGCLVIASFLIIPSYPAVFDETTPRARGTLAGFPPDPYAAFASIISAALYALAGAVAIYRCFEKTQSPEILYIAFFVLSFALEGARITAALTVKYELPGAYLVMGSRIVFFGRYFGMFSLFAASVYAAGLKAQKQSHILFILALVTAVIALGVPVDGAVWDTSLCMKSGYTAMFSTMEIGIAGITLLSFFIAAYSRGLKEYRAIALGAAMALAGRALLFSADTWITPFPALALLITGTWFICARLHQVYLWF